MEGIGKEEQWNGTRKKEGRKEEQWNEARRAERRKEKGKSE